MHLEFTILGKRLGNGRRMISTVDCGLATSRDGARARARARVVSNFDFGVHNARGRGPGRAPPGRGVAVNSRSRVGARELRNAAPRGRRGRVRELYYRPLPLTLPEPRAWSRDTALECRESDTIKSVNRIAVGVAIEQHT